MPTRALRLNPATGKVERTPEVVESSEVQTLPRVTSIC